MPKTRHADGRSISKFSFSLLWVSKTIHESHCYAVTFSHRTEKNGFFSLSLWLSLKFAFFCHFKLYEILFCSVKILVGNSLQLTWEKRAHTMVCTFSFVSDKNLSAEIVFLMQMYSCTTPLQQRWDILPQEKEELAQQIKRTRHYLKTSKISKVFGRIKSCGETLQSK